MAPDPVMPPPFKPYPNPGNKARLYRDFLIGLVFSLMIPGIPVDILASEWDDEDAETILSYPHASETLGPAALGQGRGPDLGQIASREEIAAQNLTIFPDGRGLPEGEGSAIEGEILYNQHCQSCHGPNGRGLSAEELAGGVGSLSDPIPELTVGSYWPYATTIFDYIRRAMPMAHPLSLSPDQIYALSAYLLSLSDIISANDVINEATLPGIVMPNREGFIPVYPSPSHSFP